VNAPAPIADLLVAQTPDWHAPPEIRVGIDLVQVSRIAESLEQFGERFMARLFTPGEIAYANREPTLAAERFAARFAAKEAAIKALRLSDVDEAIDWRHIEVLRTTSGACDLVLHPQVARRAGRCSLSVSLSHEGDFATAVVVAQFAPLSTTPTIDLKVTP